MAGELAKRARRASKGGGFAGDRVLVQARASQGTGAPGRRARSAW
ncbi:MAG: hypothetical protein ACYDH5_02055 [Acidimicrobiales bacterium]